MAKRVTIKCTECGAKHRVLADRLGQKRPCPKCGLQFELDAESNQSTYDLNVSPSSRPDTPDITAAWDEEDFTPESPEQSFTPPPEPEPAAADVPVLKRGVHRHTKHSGSAEKGDFTLARPVLIISGVILSILAALVVHLLTRPGGGDLPESAPTDNTAGTSESQP